MLLLGMIFLPSILCDMGSAYHSAYETVIPKNLAATGTEDPGEKVSYMLSMQGQKQLLHLKVKRDYFVNNFPVYSYHDGVLRQEMSLRSRDCHYEGYIEGVPGSFVSVNTCSGLRGVLVKGEASYGIEPLLSSNSFEHVLYTVGHQTRASCSVSSKDGHGNASPQDRSRKPVSLWAQSYLWSHTKYVEMFVVVNHQRFQMWGSNIGETVGAVMDIIALANSFTRGLDTEVVLAGMEIWTEGDLVEVPVDLKGTLWNFNRWRQEKLSHRVRHDVAHMIVGHDPGENTGQAFLNGACSGAFAAAVEAFHREDVLLFAALMVHELGHNLGIQHDHGGCVCNEEHVCLMQENITTGRGFSNCSSDDFYHFLHEHRGDCLFNKPSPQSRKRRDAVCGNGVVEGSEQCDCGITCASNKCCDEHCRLRVGADCFKGPCCSRCQFKDKGLICRYHSGSCDLPEYCDGDSATCPENRNMQDGTMCHESFHCLQGRCTDPNEQCSHVFGFGSKSAPESCYSSLNTKSDRFGNCGFTPGSPPKYIKCLPENILCGKLVCTDIAFLPTIKHNHTAIQVPYEQKWCWSMDAFEKTDVPDEGNVWDGTFCGPKKACKNFQCLAAEDEFKFSCNPKDSCNGHGVCNDLGHCHCASGFAPPDCKDEGFGGSVDSGPPGDQPIDLPGIDENERRKSKEDLALDLRLLILAIILGLLTLIIICCTISACRQARAAPEAPPPAVGPSEEEEEEEEGEEEEEEEEEEESEP